MQTRELTLVSGATAHPARPAAWRATPVLLGLFVLAAAGLATWLGADEAREVIEVQQMAEQALQTALERGSEDDAVQGALTDLRRTLGRRPLESRTRVVYASLVLGLATRVDDMQLAGFHAGRAAALSPVTVSVVRAATLVLASTGDLEQALALIRRMFGYDAPRAASTLAQIESLVFGVEIDAGIPPDPDAWVAWSRQLAIDGRNDEADAWLHRCHERWPDHLPTRVRLGHAAHARRDWDELERLLERPLPEQPDAAALFVLRGHLAWRRGDGDEAVRSAETGLGLDSSRRIRMLAGDVFVEAGRIERARQQWNRALHELDSDNTRGRYPLLLRLARLEDAHGRPGTALRLWRSLLEIDPQHDEARRRVDELAGFER